MQFLLLKVDIYLLPTIPGREMDILLCVLGKLLLQISFHCTQWSSRLCKAKQVFYAVNGNVVFRTLFSIFLGKVVISLSAYKPHQKQKVTCWS